ncbi:MAG: F0F1 ATP synthase subunit alpha [Pseudomonadota bacterium]
MSANAPYAAALAGTGLEDALAAARETPPSLGLAEIGRVLSVTAGVATVSGLTGAVAEELLLFKNGLRGQVGDLDGERAGVILLDPAEGLSAGDPVRRTGRVAETPTGEGLLGRIVDPLGRPLDTLGPVAGTLARPVEAEAPPISHRAPVRRPLLTGLKVVDAAVPIGLGQRQLIIGDRQTGKTSIALDTILNQHASELVSIYCAIGQRADAVARVVAALREAEMMQRCIVVVASGEAPPGLAFLAPYAAMTMAEHFVAKGRDALVIFDDLTRHARAYRELSLLLRRPPGREAYPGDIFYVHARLLERAGQLSAELGGGSLTALPVVETQAENLAAYIPTNLISITDGQVYLSPRLFEKGRLPAVDLGRSVSRVGGKAQLPALRAVAGDLRIALSQFEELETFARLGTRLDAATEAKLARGRAVRGTLLQGERAPLPPLAQVAQIAAATEGRLDGLDPDALDSALAAIAGRSTGDHPLGAALAAGAPLDDDARAEIMRLGSVSDADA